MDENKITADIIDAAVGIHRELGPGLLESVYELVLVAELRRRGHEVKSQVPIAFEYNGQKIENAFRIDVLVDDTILVELKSTESIAPVHAKQLKTYLVLTGKKVGLLLNFGMEYMKSGIRRVVVGEAPDLRVSAPPCESSPASAAEQCNISHGDTEARRNFHNPANFRVSAPPCEPSPASVEQCNISHGDTETRRNFHNPANLRVSAPPCESSPVTARQDYPSSTRQL